MNKLQQLWTYLQGHKTFLTAGAMIMYASLGFFLKYMTQADAMNMIFAALTLIGGRSAIQKLIDATVLSSSTPKIINQHIDLSQPPTSEQGPTL